MMFQKILQTDVASVISNTTTAILSQVENSFENHLKKDTNNSLSNGLPLSGNSLNSLNGLPQAKDFYDADISDSGQNGTPRFVSPYVCWELLETRRKTKHIDDRITQWSFSPKRFESVSSHYLTEIKIATDNLRRGVLQLQKLKHPNLINVIEGFQEDKTGMRFSSKFVRNVIFNSLRSLSVLQVRAGMLDLFEAVAFLHQGANICHLAISPHSVFIDEKYDMKLGCLGHSLPSDSVHALQSVPFSFNNVILTDKIGQQICHEPALSYCAPEMTSRYPGTCGPPSDIFSLGVLLYVLYSAAVENETNQIAPKLIRPDINRASHSAAIRGLPAGHLLPVDIAELVTRMIDPDPRKRPTASSLVDVECLSNVNVKVLRFLDILGEKDENQKKRFMIALVKLIESDSEFSNQNLLRQKILPAVLSCIDPNSVTIAPTIMELFFSVFKHIPSMNSHHFESYIWPKFSQMLTAVKIQVETVLVIVSNISSIIPFCLSSQSKSLCCAFMVKCLSISQNSLQENTLSQLPVLFDVLDRDSCIEAFFPVLLRLVTNESGMSSTRCAALICLRKLLPSLPVASIVTSVVPAVQSTCSSVLDRDLSMAVLEVIKFCAVRMPLKQSVSLLVPVASLLLTQQDLTAKDFAEVYETVQMILNKWAESRKKDFHFSEEREQSIQALMKPSNFVTSPDEGIADIISSTQKSSQRTFDKNKNNDVDDLLSLMAGSKPKTSIDTTMNNIDKNINKNQINTKIIIQNENQKNDRSNILDGLFGQSDNDSKITTQKNDDLDILFENKNKKLENNNSSSLILDDLFTSSLNQMTNFASSKFTNDPFEGLR